MTRSSTEPMASLPPGPSVQSEHGLARKPPGHQVLRYLADLLPRSLQADVRRELPCGHEIGEPPEADRCRLAPEFREEVEAVEPGTPGDEELSGVEGDLGGGGDAERDAHAGALEGRQGGAEGPPPHGLDDQIVFWRARDLLAHDHLVSAELPGRRDLVGPAHIDRKSVV